jgi:acylpyruvate hydrolase
MRLATLRLHGATAAVRVDSETEATIIDGYADLSALLAAPDWYRIAEDADGESVDLAGADYAPVLPRPGKIFCVGLNYATHIREMGRDIPKFPTLFVKFPEALTGPYDEVVVPDYAASQLDWEAELAVVIGKAGYQINEQDAEAHIAGYSAINDYTMRDFQYRTLQWDQGKNFEKTSGFGPVMVTDYRLGGRIQTHLDDEPMQNANTDDLVFSPTKLIEYISHIVTLQAGDVIITGTTGGVGHARKPPRYIKNGQVVEVTVEGIGSVRNKTIVK